MSEVTPTPEELVEEINLTVDDATVIPVPIDPTLTHEGEAADAKATGDAIAGVIDDLRVNGKAATTSGTQKVITVYAGDILMSNATGAQTIAEAFASVGDKDASQIMYDSTNLVTIKAAIDGIKADLDTELSEAEIDAIFDEVFGEGDDE